MNTQSAQYYAERIVANAQVIQNCESRIRFYRKNGGSDEIIKNDLELCDVAIMNLNDAILQFSRAFDKEQK